MNDGKVKEVTGKNPEKEKSYLKNLKCCRYIFGKEKLHVDNISECD